MLKLRDGTLTMDPRLGRLEEFDLRSRDYPVRAILDDDAEPRNRTWWCPLHLNQGAGGSCVGMACTHDLAARPHMVIKGRRFAREQIYWAAQRIDDWPGGSYPGADPVMEGTSVLAGVQTLKALGYIERYLWAFSIEELILALSHAGPSILGLPWHEGMMKPEGGELRVTGELVGKHAILAIAVDIKRQRIKLRNSWSIRWGCLGDAWIGLAELEMLLNNGGESCIPIGRRKGIL